MHGTQWVVQTWENGVFQFKAHSLYFALREAARKLGREESRLSLTIDSDVCDKFTLKLDGDTIGSILKY
jgi:hypothetical protein